MIQDIYPHKLDNQYVPAEIGDQDLVFVFANRNVLVCGDLGEELVLPRYAQVKEAVAKDNLQYIFALDDTNCFLVMEDGDKIELEGFQWIDMAYTRQVRTEVSKVSYFAIETAWHLYTWYQSVRYCGHCGCKNEHHKSLRALKCPECGNMFFPKISPAAIIGVTKGDKILMSKYAGRIYTGFALLAGFVEIGETAEESVIREVLEEVGLEVGNVRYYKSQPWGLDGNLSLGYFCDLTGEDTIVLDEEELSMARWYSRDEIPVDDDGYSLTYDMINFFKNHPEFFE